MASDANFGIMVLFVTGSTPRLRTVAAHFA